MQIASRFLIYVLSVTIVTVTFLPSPCCADWLSQAKADWAEYSKSAQLFQGTATVTTALDGPPKVTALVEVKQNTPWRMFRGDQTMDERPRDTVAAVNSEYAFELKRKSTDIAWVQSNGARVGAAMSFMDPHDDQLKSFTCQLYSCPRVFVWELFEQPDFKVVSAKEEIRDGHAYWRVIFTNEHDINSVKPFCPIQKGEILLDPEGMWCIKEASFDSLYSNDRVKDGVSASYRLQDGIPVPQMVKFTKHSEDIGEYVVAYESAFEMPATLPDESEFQLSAFGFGEPREIQKRSNLWLWCAIVGVAFVFLALFGKWMSRRKTT